MEEILRSNIDEWEREEEDVLTTERKIKRDYYVDEVLAITVDYMKAAEESGIAFPKERVVRTQPRRSWLSLGF